VKTILKHHRNRTLDNNGAEICNNVGTRDVISRPGGGGEDKLPC
jgi:hypothetical protein